MKILAIVAIVMLSACAGGGGGISTLPAIGSAGANSQGSVSPPSPIAASPSSLMLNDTAAHTVALTEAGYTGAFSETDTCLGVARVALSGSRLTVTAIAGGGTSCAITARDANAQALSIPVTVSATVTIPITIP